MVYTPQTFMFFHQELEVLFKVEQVQCHHWGIVVSCS